MRKRVRKGERARERKVEREREQGKMRKIILKIDKKGKGKKRLWN